MKKENGFILIGVTGWLPWNFRIMGKTVSFTSTTCLANGTWEFQKKKGILLLEFDSLARVEHLDVYDVLGEDNKYPGENEILFPPFLDIKMEEVDLTENEKNIVISSEKGLKLS